MNTRKYLQYPRWTLALVAVLILAGATWPITRHYWPGVQAQDATRTLTEQIAKTNKGTARVPMELSVVQAAVAHGADVNTQLPDGSTALHCVAWDIETPPDDQLTLARLLIDHRADVNVRDGEGETPLIVAARQVKPDLVRLLLDQGALVNGETPGTRSALSYAAQWVESSSRYGFKTTPQEPRKVDAQWYYSTRIVKMLQAAGARS